MGSGGQNESKFQKLAPIDKKKIFYEFDVHHVKKVGIKRFWAQKAKMSLSAKKLDGIGEKKIFNEHDVHHV